MDGIYWHGKNKTWNELNATQRRVITNDKKKNQIAYDNGYDIIRVWEDEVEFVSKYFH